MAITTGCLLLASLGYASISYGHGLSEQTQPRQRTRMGLAQRAAAMSTTVMIEAARRAAPDAVRGRCPRTIDVPLQGDSCNLGRGMWALQRADGTMLATHGPDVFDAATPDITLSSADRIALDSAGDVSVAADDTVVSCSSIRTMPRTIAVFAKPYGVSYTSEQVQAISIRIRSELRRASTFIQRNGARDRGGQTSERISIRMHCADRQIDVRVIDLPDLPRDETGSVRFLDIEQAVRAQLGLPLDDAARIVAYAPFDMYGVSGQGSRWGDTRPTRDNANNDSDAFAVHYMTSPAMDPTSTDGIHWYVFAHEMLHNMGAVTNDTASPDANGFGHCTSDADLMCYDEHGVSTTRRCATIELDCGSDTYFNAADVVGGWLATSWNVGHQRNRYLDFASRTPPDIIAPAPPARVQATLTSTSAIDVTWDASTDPSGIARYEVLYGVDRPQLQVTTMRTRALVPVNSSERYTFWVRAVDAHGNVSNRSSPIVSNTASPPPSGPRPQPAAPPAAGGDMTGASPHDVRDDDGDDESDPAPESVGSLRVDDVRVGTIELAWTTNEQPGTTYAVEVRERGASGAAAQWRRVRTLPSHAENVIIAAPSGAPMQARVISTNRVGERASGIIPFSTAAPGSSCVWHARDRSAPRAPGRLRLSTTRGRARTLSFTPAADPNGVCALRVFMRSGSARWNTHPSIAAGRARRVKLTRLPRRANVQIAIEAIDARGNISRRTMTRARIP